MSQLEEMIRAARLRRSKKVDWYEFVDIEANLCALCGNSGILETEAFNPQRTAIVGYRGPCVCPNGRALKKGGACVARTWTRKLERAADVSEAIKAQRFAADSAIKEYLSESVEICPLCGASGMLCSCRCGE